MKDIEKMFDEGLRIVSESCGSDSFEGVIARPVTISNSTSRWGSCRTTADRKRHRITISKLILEDMVPDDAVMSVIVHDVPTADTVMAQTYVPKRHISHPHQQQPDAL